MRATKLDFVRQPSPLRGLSFILLVLGAATAAYVAHVYLERSTELESWESKYRSLQKEQRKRAGSDVAKTAEWEHLQTELKAANRVIARLSLPWDALFREVEASVDDQVSLLSVEPNTEKHELKITAEAKNLDAMLGYARRVQAASLFKGVYVVSHQIQQQDPQKPVRFVINAEWLEIPKPAVETPTITMVGGPE